MLMTIITPDHDYYLKVSDKGWGDFYFSSEDALRCYFPDAVWLCNALRDSIEVISGVHLTGNQVDKIGRDKFC